MNVFVSFHPNQRRVAKGLQKMLVRSKINATSFDLSSQLGPNIHRPPLFEKIVGHQDYFIVLLSKDYVADTWLVTEMGVFLSEEGRRGRSQIVIPITLDMTKMPDILEPGKRKSFDLNEILENSIEGLTEFIFQEILVFTIMKLGDKELDNVYFNAIKPALTLNNLMSKRIDENDDGGKISAQILADIKRSQIVICDLTGERPNCLNAWNYN